MREERIIGRYTGNEKGPLLLVLSGIHGNEIAGVRALELLFKMIEVEPITNPDFEFRGRFLGLRGNLQALAQKRRYIEWDMNRMMTPETVDRLLLTDPQTLRNEEKELHELISLIRSEIDDYQPEELVVLDLHSTTAYGGIFTIATDSPKSIYLAIELHAPVVKGFLRGIRGTTLHYFTTENMGCETVALCFESGQHNEQISVNRAIAAITNCMRSIGCVKPEHVENRHDQLLIEFSKDLPKVSELVYNYQINHAGNFEMVPNFRNFQRVSKGDLLAYDNGKPVFAPTDGLILMPLYQEQGEDGFFIVKSLTGV